MAKTAITAQREAHGRQSVRRRRRRSQDSARMSEKDTRRSSSVASERRSSRRARGRGGDNSAGSAERSARHALRAQNTKAEPRLRQNATQHQRRERKSEKVRDAAAEWRARSGAADEAAGERDDEMAEMETAAQREAHGTQSVRGRRRRSQDSAGWSKLDTRRSRVRSEAAGERDGAVTTTAPAAQREARGRYSARTRQRRSQDSAGRSEKDTRRSSSVVIEKRSRR